MIKMTTPFAVTVMIFTGLAGAPAALADSNQVASGMGHELTRHICSTCHLVEAGQSNPPDHVGGPSFQSIADRPDVTARTLRKHLRTTHTNTMIPLAMPNPGLSEDELVKIISYLVSLRTPH